MDTKIEPAKIEKAMDALLCAILKNEARLAGRGRLPADDVASAAEIVEGDVIDRDLDGIIDDPVGVACRSEIAALGSLLFETIGSTEKTEAVVSRVAAMDTSQATRRREILEEAWAHVGPEGNAGWE